MLGERGGSVVSLDEARELQEAHKELWSATIRGEIRELLAVHGMYHADDLIALGIPADCKNIVGAQTNALVRQGWMEETGERRSTSDPAGHGRRSAVYRITALGSTKLRPVTKPLGEDGVESSAGGSVASRGSSSGSRETSPCRAAAAISGRDHQAAPAGGDGPSSAVTALPTLFAPDDFARPVSRYGDAA